jgi:hypothetical protein
MSTDKLRFLRFLKNWLVISTFIVTIGAENIGEGVGLPLHLNKRNFTLF